MLSLALVLWACCVNAFELFPAKLKLYDHIQSFTLRGVGLTAKTTLQLYPSPLHQYITQSVNTNEQSITFISNQTTWFTVDSNRTILSIYARVSRTQKLLLAEIYRAPQVFPATLPLDALEQSATFHGVNLDAKRITSLEFNQPISDDAYEFSANLHTLTIYLLKPPPDLHAPLLLQAISGPAGRIPIQQVSMHSFACIQTFPEILPPNNAIIELYRTGMDPLLLFGVGLHGNENSNNVVIGFKHSRAVQFRDFTLDYPATPPHAVLVYPKPTSFVEWTAEDNVLVVDSVNGRKVHIPVAIMRTAPIVLRNTNQFASQLDMIRVRGSGFVGNNLTKIGISIAPESASLLVAEEKVELEQNKDFVLFVSSSLEMEVEWLSPRVVSPFQVFVDWIQIGSAPQIIINTVVAHVMNSAGPQKQGKLLPRLYQTLSRRVSFPMNGTKDGNCEVTVAFRTRTTTKQFKFSKAPMKDSVVTITLAAKFVAGWQLGTMFVTSVRPQQRGGVDLVDTKGFPVAMVQADPVILATKHLRICHTKTTQFTIEAKGITLETKFTFSPVEFQVEPEFQVENDQVTFTRKPPLTAVAVGNTTLPIIITSVDAGAGVVQVNQRIAELVDDANVEYCQQQQQEQERPQCSDSCGSSFIKDGICDDWRGTGLCPPCSDCSDCSPCATQVGNMYV